MHHAANIFGDYHSKHEFYRNPVTKFVSVKGFPKSYRILRMVSSGMLRRVALVRTEVSEELSASFIRAIRIGELGTTLAVTSNRRKLRRNTKLARLLVTASVVPSSSILVKLMKEPISYSGTSVLTRATWRNIPEDDILHSHRREYLKSYIALTGWSL
jgi:hypothetical protein